MIYLTLFYEFFKAGLFAIGGGLATLPFLSRMADMYPWLTHAQLADMIAVSESTPGAIGINCATYAGFHAAGIPGAVVATLSLVLPSYLVILAVAGYWKNSGKTPWYPMPLKGCARGHRLDRRRRLERAANCPIGRRRRPWAAVFGPAPVCGADGVDQPAGAQKAAPGAVYRPGGGVRPGIPDVIYDETRGDVPLPAVFRLLRQRHGGGTGGRPAAGGCRQAL